MTHEELAALQGVDDDADDTCPACGAYSHYGTLCQPCLRAANAVDQAEYELGDGYSADDDGEL